MTDTIFALSSGRPPAAIAVMRISGPDAGAALAALAGNRPEPRRASFRALRDTANEVLDHALVLWLPGPGNATGEDCAELHLHGGAAIIRAVEASLARLPGLRPAVPGEFTRRAFTNGRLALSEAEGLADLLEAETELQRRHALALADGALSRQFANWRDAILALSAEVESVLDFSDEEDGQGLSAQFDARLRDVSGEIADWLAQPRAERLKEGYRVVLAGPPNAGKSTLFNALVGEDAAIATAVAGTTRDVLERTVAIEGIPVMLTDTAGLHDASHDPVEGIGIARARKTVDAADLVLWLGSAEDAPSGSWRVRSKSDLADSVIAEGIDYHVSAMTGDGIPALLRALADEARQAMPRAGRVALNARQHGIVAEMHDALVNIGKGGDLLIIGENLRRARECLDRLVGKTATEDMLDTLFGRFCIGK